ncbi:hypothetical protein ACF061_00530 [Streptomyces sp. NPDC015220]|uniref:hypothetical protein n=1 Tax=Streptomyces sp. NPDC015220 TaxID=3364947 RepID=UPI0036FC9757
MRTRIISAALLCAVASLTVACQPNDTNSSDSGSGSSSAPSSASSKDDKPAGAVSKTVQNFVGMGLQSAQDAAQADGFYSLKSHDALGRDRMQAFDRNWKVCSQNVAVGKSVPTDTTLDFGAVKLEESCPSKDEKEPTVSGGRMPDFEGKSVKAARAALDSGTSFTVKDASSDSRWILVESNWQVCSQTPAAGASLNGQPVALTAVKFGETCP